MTGKQKSQFLTAIADSCSALDEGSQQWVRSRLGELGEHPAALRAIARLHSAGCEATVILLWTKLQSEVVTEEEFRRRAAMWEMVKERAGALVPKLKHLAGEIEELHNSGIDCGSFLGLYSERIRRSSSAADVDKDVVEAIIKSIALLPTTLRDYADDVGNYARFSVDLQTTFTRIRDFYLALLCVYAETIAPTTKYADLAEVIAFGNHASALSAADVEQRYALYRRQNPDLVTRMESFVRSYNNNDARTQESFLSWSQNHWLF